MTAGQAVLRAVVPHAIWMMKSRSDADVRVLVPSDAVQAIELYNELTVGPPARGPDAFETVISHQGTQVFGSFE
ncbi:hypothetical protein GGR93_001427 [Sulfitobacter noctilucicola]|uniref:Uncharacterized protein n=2 Tax=Sulfitobacter noctilucicola TaxID=1342301 RepID=A0A7W6M764_9RHOB|nr:hypothetical protein [Sulfitobacter noctilucicola]